MKKGNSLAGNIFGSFFFLAGLVVFYFSVISPVFDAIQMQFWQQGKAQLLQADVTSFQSRNDDGSYTTLYNVEMSFQYKVADQKYFGSRAKINNNSSNSDSDEAYQLLSRMKNEQTRNQYIMIWYQPSSPSNSIYDRSISIKFTIIMTMFSAVFMMIGAGIVRYSSKKKSENIALNHEDPSKPWTTRAQWASPIIYSQAESKTKTAWFFAILSLLFFGMFSLMLLGQHPVASFFALVLLIVPSWLIIRAKGIQKEWQFYQKVPLTLKSYPGIVGGKVEGSLVIPKSSATEHYTISLICTKYWTSGSGDNKSSNQSIVYSSEQHPMTKSKVEGNHLSFNFSVSADKPESSYPSNNYHTWTINVKSKNLGLTASRSEAIKFARDYEVPVFITQESQTVEQELVAAPLSSLEKHSIKERLDINSSSQVISLHTPGSKHSLVFAGIGSLFFVIGVLIATVGESFFGIIFSLMSCVFIFLGLWGWARNCKINITPNSFEIDVYWLSRLMKNHVFCSNDIKEIQAFKSSSGHTNGRQTSEKFCLRLLTILGKRMDLGGEFKSMKNAVHMKNEIERVLNNN